MEIVRCNMYKKDLRERSYCILSGVLFDKSHCLGCLLSFGTHPYQATLLTLFAVPFMF